ncbi:hypothetical protein [Burkholderia gladioli]|uniref:hypothetical protein n=1 Tax=Burkholderia gladioli TaxID=28095 RepID=UPI001641EC9B|nr:hypothetical protein [Burkholderia gladioli]
MSKWKAIVNDYGVIFESCLGRDANQIEPVIFREKSKESDYGRLRSGLTRAGCGTDRDSGRATDEAISPGRRASCPGGFFPLARRLARERLPIDSCRSCRPGIPRCSISSAAARPAYLISSSKCRTPTSVDDHHAAIADRHLHHQTDSLHNGGKHFNDIRPETNSSACFSLRSQLFNSKQAAYSLIKSDSRPILRIHRRYRCH